MMNQIDYCIDSRVSVKSVTEVLRLFLCLSLPMVLASCITKPVRVDRFEGIGVTPRPVATVPAGFVASLKNTPVGLILSANTRKEVEHNREIQKWIKERPHRAEEFSLRNEFSDPTYITSAAIGTLKKHFNDLHLLTSPQKNNDRMIVAVLDFYTYATAVPSGLFGGLVFTEAYTLSLSFLTPDGSGLIRTIDTSRTAECPAPNGWSYQLISCQKALLDSVFLALDQELQR